MPRVHQLLSGAGPHDAITTEAVHFRALFTRWGWGGGDWAARIVPGISAIQPIGRFHADPTDLLLLHHSAAMPRLSQLLALPNPMLLLYHNITPAGWLWDHAPVVAAHCEIGRAQLEPILQRCDRAAADSAFNAQELKAFGGGEVDVIPLPVDPAHLGPPGPEPTEPPTVLFVGRLSPHKRQEEVIAAFAAYRRERAPEARLILVGDPLTADYATLLRGLGERLAPGAVTVESGIDQASLAQHYRSAHALLCLSAHEGFCIPLLEAFHFGVPIVARPAGAVPEVLGDAGLLVPDTDPAVVAELLHLVVIDRPLRDELRHRGHHRLRRFAPAQTAEALRRAIEATFSERREISV